MNGTLEGLLRKGLEDLDDEARVALVLRDLVELPIEEVATILNRSPGAAIQGAHRARLALRGVLDGWFAAAGDWGIYCRHA